MSQDVFENRNLAALAVPSISPVACAMAMLIADRFGRRPLLLMSSAGIAVSAIALALVLGWSEQLGFTAAVRKWLSLSALMAFMFSFQFGMGPVPGLVITEIVPPRIRGLGAAFVGVVAGAAGNAVIYGILPLEELIGFGWLFLAYSVGAVLSFLFILGCVPETKGQTLVAINEKIKQHSAAAAVAKE